jgi:uncharacterized membrane protein
MINGITKDLKSYYNETPEVRAGFKIGSLLFIAVLTPSLIRLLNEYYTMQEIASGFSVIVITGLIVMLYQLLVARERHVQSINDMLQKNHKQEQ